MTSFFRAIVSCGSVSVEPAMTVAGAKQPEDNTTKTVIQVEVVPEHKNYSRVPTSPNSDSDCLTESNGATDSGNTIHINPVSTTSSNSSVICRICQDVDKTENLKTLCQCTGSIAKYHVSCLEKWLSVAKTDICELCHQHFMTKRKPRPFSEIRAIVHGTQTYTHKNEQLVSECIDKLEQVSFLRPWTTKNELSKGARS